jgi:uncharacterized membrane protein
MKGILIFLISCFVLYFSFVAFSRHDNFYSRRLDLGNMDQTVWNVLHGNGFTLTDPMGIVQESRLAVHADFLLILLAPFYLIWSNPKMLILIQVVVAGLGAIPVYWIAYEKIRSKKVALLFAGMYLFYPPMQRRMLSDFHAVSLATTFLLYAFWYIEKKEYILFSLFAILAGLTKETVWLTVSIMGGYIYFWKKSKGVGLATAAISAGIFYYLFWVAIPAVTPARQHFALVYLSEYGESLNGILKNLLSNPFIVIKTFFLPDRLYYYFQMLSPVGFLSLLSPFFLFFASESIVINTLSNNQLMRQIDYQYGSTIMPFIFISAIYGFTVFTRYFKQKKQLLLSFLGLIFIITVYLWGEFPIGKSQWFWFFITPLPEKQIMKQVEKQIDSRYSVSATNNIGSHFSQRQFLYNFPVNALSSDYSIIYLGDPYAWPSGDEQKAMVNSLLASPTYEVISHQGNFYAFKKKNI